VEDGGGAGELWLFVSAGSCSHDALMFPTNPEQNHPHFKNCKYMLPSAPTMLSPSQGSLDESTSPEQDGPTKTAPSLIRQTLDPLDPKLTKVFLPWALRHPRYLRAAARLARGFKHSRHRRALAEKEGVKVPSFLIISITSNCNLRCQGCFASAVGTVAGAGKEEQCHETHQLDSEGWQRIIREARELGVFCFVVAGGEPFLFPGLVKLCHEFRDRPFLILTNGTTLTKEHYRELKRSTNIAVLVSVEGGSELTDERRGKGVYEKVLETLEQLRGAGVPSGISVTITRRNAPYWMDPANIDLLIEKDIRIATFLEYIPITPAPSPDTGSRDSKGYQDQQSDHELMLTPEERARFREQVLSYRAEKPIYLVHSPGDEEFFGGCVSAGRGFAHVTPTGDLTPCPVSNLATHNLTTSSLKDALASPLFREIRENEHLLETEDMPCALFAHPEEVDSLARAVGAYRTG